MEEEYRLPFATFIKLDSDIAELIIDHGLELDVAMVTALHQWMLDHLEAPFSVLVNRINSYSYSPESQFILGSLEELNAIAEVAYSLKSRLVVEILADMPRDHPWNMECFSDRASALTWLYSQQDQKRKRVAQ